MQSRIKVLMRVIILTCSEMLKISTADLSVADSKGDQDHAMAFARDILIIKQLRSIAKAVRNDTRANKNEESVRELLQLTSMSLEEMLKKVATKRSLHPKIIRSFDEAYKIALTINSQKEKKNPWSFLFNLLKRIPVWKEAPS